MGPNQRGDRENLATCPSGARIRDGTLTATGLAVVVTRAAISRSGSATHAASCGHSGARQVDRTLSDRSSNARISPRDPRSLGLPRNHELPAHAQACQFQDFCGTHDTGHLKSGIGVIARVHEKPFGQHHQSMRIKSGLDSPKRASRIGISAVRTATPRLTSIPRVVQ